MKRIIRNAIIGLSSLAAITPIACLTSCKGSEGNIVDPVEYWDTGLEFIGSISDNGSIIANMIFKTNIAEFNCPYTTTEKTIEGNKVRIKFSGAYSSYALITAIDTNNTEYEFGLRYYLIPGWESSTLITEVITVQK